ncbi:hypothetical protein HYU14_00665 [Candidatus Woesearchaeota archaeon]|nr:hypothetical protein [Candidatus Woesearchaeota archaeon]
MGFIVTETHHAVYFLNGENHRKFVDAVPVREKLDCIISELFGGGKATNGDSRCFTATSDERYKREFSQKCPVYVGDIPLNHWKREYEIDKFDKHELTKDAAQMAAGFLLALGGFESAIFLLGRWLRGEMTRRDFLGRGVRAAGIGSLYLLYDFFNVRPFNLKKAKANKYRELSLEFERWWIDNGLTYYINCRDAVIAHKAEEGIFRDFSGIFHKPKIGIYYGSFHITGIKKMLHDKDLREKYLQILLDWRHLFDFDEGADCHSPKGQIPEKVWAFEYTGGNNYKFKKSFCVPFPKNMIRPDRRLSSTNREVRAMETPAISRRDFLQSFFKA